MAVILRAALLAAIVAGQDNSGWQPSVLWSRELGEGYAGLAVAGSRLVTMYRRGDDEVIVALDRETGKTLWEHAYAAPPLEGQDLSQGVGPHATPLVAPDGAVCAAGVTGRLTCLDIVTGRRVVLGRAGAPPVDLPRAVLASAAIPGLYQPVQVGRSAAVLGAPRPLSA